MEYWAHSRGKVENELNSWLVVTTKRDILHILYPNLILWPCINSCSTLEFGQNHAEAVPIRKLKKAWHSCNIVTANQRLGVQSQKTTSQPFQMR
jgi:hypothetical protein